MPMKTKCRICHRVAEIDTEGRCELCATVLAAARENTSYGRYVAAHQTQKPETEEEPETIVNKQGQILHRRVCKQCGGTYYSAKRNTCYCGDMCRLDAAARRGKEFVERRRRENGK